ncbi:hypothetical protein RND81_01G097900 [Saponaria officinalis]|uniref:AP2/ERF domain-containing protein n=1 Tax=Saponaria officinalis TaxID=3572 RepID=A0AAW1NCW8_SAPOF
MKQHGENSKAYKGIRMRKWGKWVAEIREPNKRTRMWLGSYKSPVAAARAYDIAVYYLRGPTAHLNFPGHLEVDKVNDDQGHREDISAAHIRKKATEVGARVDAIETALVEQKRLESTVLKDKPDLNEFPSFSDCHDV